MSSIRTKIPHLVLLANIVFANIETLFLILIIGTLVIIIRSVVCAMSENGMKVPIRFAQVVGPGKGRSAVRATVVLWERIQVLYQMHRNKRVKLVVLVNFRQEKEVHIV